MKKQTRDENGDRLKSELLRIWKKLSADQRDHFIEEQCTIREVFRLDQAGVLDWAPLPTGVSIEAIRLRAKSLN